MSAKLKNAPLFYTVGQIRFNPVLNMSSYIADIQSELRKTFPDFLHEVAKTLQVNVTDPDKLPEIKSMPLDRWHFKDAKKTSGYILLNDSIIFHTTAYLDSAHFLSSLTSGLSIVHEKVSLAYIEGVGIRTLDAIIPGEGHGLADYLHSGLLGIFPEIEGELKHSVSEMIINGPYGQLNSKVAFVEGSVGIPFDLAPISLQLSERVQGNLGKHAILDNDCAIKDRFTYDISEVARILRVVKTGASLPFYKSVKPFALESWE